ncbi:MAG: deoxyguanosinetriphosphate triphosphohydrolase, partial [Raoultibacter sp.]
IAMSDPLWTAMSELRKFLFDRVYTAPQVLEEVRKATHLLGDLFDYYVDHMEEVPSEYRAISEGDDLRAVTDYIAGMTDRYAKSLYQDIFIPQSIYR